MSSSLQIALSEKVLSGSVSIVYPSRHSSVNVLFVTLLVASVALKFVLVVAVFIVGAGHSRAEMGLIAYSFLTSLVLPSHFWTVSSPSTLKLAVHDNTWSGLDSSATPKPALHL